MTKLITFAVALFLMTACGGGEVKEETDSMKSMGDQKAAPMKLELQKKAEEAKDEADDKMKEGAEKAAQATQAAPSGETMSSVQCTLNNDTRVIEVGPSESKACEVFYTKEGERRSVATANNDVSHCSNVADRMKTRLVEAGFTCQ